MTVRIKTTFHPRNDIVLCRVVPVVQRMGIFMPEVSQEGKQYVVEAIGPKVEGLKVGDKVLVKGVFKVDYDFLPNFHDIFMTPEKNVTIIYTEEEVGEE